MKEEPYRRGMRVGTKIRFREFPDRTGIYAARLSDPKRACVIVDGDEHEGPKVVWREEIEVIPK